MSVADTKAGLPDDLADRLSDASSLVIVCLCAAWCDTCTAFRASFERIAAGRPREAFVWLDVEDDSEICGDIDIENFPTLAVYRGGVLLHYGVSLPQEGSVARLVDEMATRDTEVMDAPQPVLDLPQAMARASG